jgi:hypothetical protein
MTAADYLGNPVSTAEPAALAAVDEFVGGFLAYETRAANILKTAAAAPDAPLLNAYAGCLFMLLESPSGPPRAAPFLHRAAAAPHANPREAATTFFLAAWHVGDIPAARTLSADIVAQWPRDLAMLKLNQYLAFNAGDAPVMLRVAQGAAAANDDIPQMHGMLAFGYEQCHLLDDAEAAARRALRLTEREPWAQHALAHVMLTQGRIDEGAAFMAAAAPTWSGLNSFIVTHNWWHQALFLLSQGRDDAVLAIFDAYCWTGDRTYSQDQINAVSLLARLELAGVDVGDRWADVAEHLAARGPDAESPFLALQYLYGLARAGRAEAEPQLDAIRRQAATAPPFSRPVWAQVALPAAEAILAHLAGDHAAAIRGLGPVLPRMAEIGGSHAQRDLFDQILLSSVLADGRWTQAQQTLELRRAFDPAGVPLNRALARVYEALEMPALSARASQRADATARRHAG